MTFEIGDQFAKAIRVISKVTEGSVAVIAKPASKCTGLVTMVKFDTPTVAATRVAFSGFLGTSLAFATYAMLLVVEKLTFLEKRLSIFFIPTSPGKLASLRNGTVRKTSGCGYINTEAAARFDSLFQQKIFADYTFVSTVAQAFPARAFVSNIPMTVSKDGEAGELLASNIYAFRHPRSSITGAGLEETIALQGDRLFTV